MNLSSLVHPVILAYVILLLHNTQGQNFATWGNWGEQSQCSRTCGGGVSHRTRKCHHGTPGVSRGCQGEDIIYESCNTQPCPEGLESFRSVQCRRFNDVPYQVQGVDRYLAWEPHQDEASPCILHCRARETGEARVLQERVADGTECDSFDSHGVCVAGNCKEVGCDRKLGSMVGEDNCRVCGGKDESCQPITGIFKEQKLKVGENEVATIPAGSTNIVIKELAPSSNYLVLQSRDGITQWDSRRSREDNSTFLIGGAKYRYAKISPTDITESLISRGPTNSTLRLNLMYRNDNKGVQFEFYIPKSRVLEANPNQPFNWIHGAWTGCSAECGDGYQLRAVSCIDRSSGASVDDGRCQSGDKPASRQSCNIKPCGTADNWYRWVPGHWGPCSVNCGVGEQTQVMYCVESGASGDTVYVSEELCERYAEKAQLYKRACEGDGDECPYWATTAWGECSVTCGYGRQSRQVYCQQDPSDPLQTPIQVDDSLCTQAQPDTHMICRLDPCPDGSNAQSTVQVEDSENCIESDYGCCPDGDTPASGPGGQGCPTAPSATNGCLLEPERGPCADYTIQWHFVPQDQKCRRFWYGGCKGNGNRFETEEACEAKCLQQASRAGDQTTGDCTSRTFGCCPDGVTPARGHNNEGCPNTTDRNENNIPVALCKRSRFGCCADGVSAAAGPNQQGCASEEIRVRPSGDSDAGRDADKGCKRSRYGCCADGVTAAQGWNQEGCVTETKILRRCEQSYYGCCPNSDIAAAGPNNKGCEASTTDFDTAACGEESDKGECSDYSVQWYYDQKASSCKRFWYGGCGGNGNRFATEEQCELGCVNATGPAVCRLPAVTGPCRAAHQRFFFNHKTGKCEEFVYGGCKGNDNRFRSIAECEAHCHQRDGPLQPGTDRDRGNEVSPSTQVDLCAVSTYGCCPDRITAATGLNYHGCAEPCESVPHGCCEDGVTTAQGPNNEGCPEEGSGFGDCETSRYGCCPDGVTAASGPNRRGCSSIAITDDGEKKRPTTTTTKAPPAMNKCQQSSDRGPCSDYVVRWYHKKDQQECAQFWYGGCQGNENRFETRDECEAECIATEGPSTEDPDFVSICDMPQETGPCRASLPRWYYNRLDRQCRTFMYGGCQGNENNFMSLQECQQTCMGVVPTQAPTLPVTTTTPAPYTLPPPKSSSIVMTGADSVAVGSELRLTCRAEGPQTPTHIEWFINGKPIGRERDNLSVRSYATPVDHSFTSELIITRSSKENSATYYCRSVPYSDVERKNIIVSREVAPATTTTSTTTTTTPRPTEVLTPRPDYRGESSDPREVCRLPAAAGNCRAYLQRWYYDGSYQTCRQFVYGGCDGNSNNFETEADCNSYCRRGEVAPATTTTNTTTTTTTPWPTEVLTPRPDYRGESSDPREVCRLPAAAGNCRAYLQRWYYDGSYQTCRQFVYGGCDGNSNNFETKADCNNYCHRGGSPDVAPDDGGRQTADPNTVCQQPAEVGNCRAALPRWHYNSQEGRCERFNYGGCNGNSNNFESEQDCKNYCRTEDICQQPQMTGPCRAGLQRYFYNSTSGQCQQFTYGGCQGNLNNFATLSACQRKCAGGAIIPQTKTRQVCSLPPDGGPCRGYNILWYYDDALRRCQRFIYGGCDGNGNQFKTEEECSNLCVVVTPRPVPPTVAPLVPQKDVCEMPNDRGRCSNYTIHWYYDFEKAYCTRFYYGGCDGNGNRFRSREECEQRCVNRQIPIMEKVPETTTESTYQPPVQCAYSRFGCCDDGYTPAIDMARTNCRDDSVMIRPSEDGNQVLANRGSTAHLDCFSPGSAISWYRDGYYLSSDSRFQIYNNGTLVIRNIADDITGTYACRISDGNSIPQVTRYIVQLKMPLSILQTPPSISVGPGQNAYLHCQALGTPTPRVSWSFQGSAVTSKGRNIVFNNGTLVVVSVGPQDTGNYQCTAENGVDTPVSRTVKVTIEETLTAKILPHSGQVMEGEMAELKCGVSGYPNPTVHWEKNGIMVTNSDKMYVRGNDLYVTRVGIEDAGLFSCVATNKFGKARDLTYLQIKLPNHHDSCTDTMPKMKCQLIVSARLCGFRMFSLKCCTSCQDAGLI